VSQINVNAGFPIVSNYYNKMHENQLNPKSKPKPRNRFSNKPWLIFKFETPGGSAVVRAARGRLGRRPARGGGHVHAAPAAAGAGGALRNGLPGQVQVAARKAGVVAANQCGQQNPGRRERSAPKFGPGRQPVELRLVAPHHRQRQAAVFDGRSAGEFGLISKSYIILECMSEIVGSNLGWNIQFFRFENSFFKRFFLRTENINWSKPWNYS